MVYEIYFEPKGAVWRIRIVTFVMSVWPVGKVVMKTGQEGPLLEPADFSTFEDAEKYVRRVGLDKAYQRRERRGAYTTQVHGVLVHGSSSIPNES